MTTNIVNLAKFNSNKTSTKYTRDRLQIIFGGILPTNQKTTARKQKNNENVQRKSAKERTKKKIMYELNLSSEASAIIVISFSIVNNLVVMEVTCVGETQAI